MNYPKDIINLIECYKRLPGIGAKSAERMALATLQFDKKTIKTFSETLNKITTIKKCKSCNNYSDNDICNICSDNTRDNKIICVVEEPKNINLFEKTQKYNGKYFVLNGLISPLNGINPSDINIDQLIQKVNDENINEIIIAVKPSIEGETTALYISKILDDKVIVSKLASGIPVGIDIDYMDSMTISTALEQRKKI